MFSTSVSPFAKGMLVGGGIVAGLAGFAWVSRNIEWVGARLFLGVDIGEMLEGRTREEGLIRHVFATAKRGEAASVLAAMDDFVAKQGFMMSVGPEKAAMVATEVKKTLTGDSGRSALLVDVGTYCGYSALVLAMAAREVTSSFKVISIEFNPAVAAIAMAIIDYAGLRGHVEVRVGDALKELAAVTGETADVIVFDHWERLYVPTLKVVEEKRLIRAGGLLLADNVKSNAKAGDAFVAAVEASIGVRWTDVSVVDCKLQYSATEDAMLVARAL